MTSVDLAVLGVMFLSGLLAFSRGLVREVLSIGAWLGAAVIAMSLLSFVHPLLDPHMPSPEWTDPAGFILLFLISLILLSLVAKAIGGAVRSSGIGGIDRSLGLVFGLARGAVLAIAVYIVACMAIPPDRWPDQVLESRSLPYIYKGAAWVAHQVPQQVPAGGPGAAALATNRDGRDIEDLSVGPSDRPAPSQVTGNPPHG